MKTKYKQLKLRTYDITFDKTKYDLYGNNDNSPWWQIFIYDNNNKPIKFSKLTTEQNKTIYNFNISGISGIKKAKAFSGFVNVRINANSGTFEECIEITSRALGSSSTAMEIIIYNTLIDTSHLKIVPKQLSPDV